ncbi:MAG TPA: transglycosylase SLT domain-containing protein [Nocardioides sp.]|nr:transglycosylase SLT domain-containing protein [Nocardioides sp.]
MAAEENRVASVAGTVGLVVLVAALLIAAVRWGGQGNDPLTSAPAPSASVGTSVGTSMGTTTAARSASPVDDRKRGAIAKVPRAVIMRQLARLAERIARHTPMPTVPDGISPGSNQALGYHLLVEFGFAADQWPYLNALWIRESGWNHLAENPHSGAYGIPQSLPATKMAVVGPDWRTNPETQIKWGLAYIGARYGTPQGAWAHETKFGWY